MNNLDPKTVQSFADEWSRFDQGHLDESEHAFLFETYFNIFPWDLLPKEAKGFDMGCGSGRWAMRVAPQVGHLTCIDPAPEALAVARRKLSHLDNVTFVNASVGDAPLCAESQDFGYSLGVLHHVPDTASALQDCVSMLRPGAPFLLYLYYRFDNRPLWYRFLWRASNLLRLFICRLPASAKVVVTDIIAALVYLPLAWAARMGKRLGARVENWPLSNYSSTSFQTMRTDSRDRFGTPLEQRFTRAEINAMMQAAGLEDIRFSESFPFWCAVGLKAATSS